MGWYYTDWLTALGQDNSMPTIELGRQIVDSFVDTCARKCRGQLTTLTITGRVPVLHNGQRSELILVFDDETPYGYVARVQAVYKEKAASKKGPYSYVAWDQIVYTTDTVAKAQEALQPGDVLEFICDYYTLNGSGIQYQDSYLPGDPLTVTEEELTISNVPLVGNIRAAYRFTDLYGSHCWTNALPSYRYQQP